MKADDVVASVGWRAHVKEGLKLLQSSRLDARELCTVLGEEARAIVKLFLGRSTTQLDDSRGDAGSVVEALAALLVVTPESIVAQLPHDPEPSVASPEAPPPQALPMTSDPAVTESNVSSESTQTGGPATRTRRSRTSSSRPEEGRGEPRRKRRKTTNDDDEVIDLT